MQMRLPFPRERTTISCGHPEKKHYSKGMCAACYHRQYRLDKPMIVAMAQERYQAKKKVKHD